MRTPSAPGASAGGSPGANLDANSRWVCRRQPRCDSCNGSA